LEKVLIANADECTGCRICELVCSMTKQGECSPRKSYIRIMRNKEMDIHVPTLSTQCDFCGECVEWCLPEAIKFVHRQEAILSWKGVRIGSLPAPLFSNR